MRKVSIDIELEYYRKIKMECIDRQTTMCSIIRDMLRQRYDIEQDKINEVS
jgi:hypothetical protein